MLRWLMDRERRNQSDVMRYALVELYRREKKEPD